MFTANTTAQAIFDGGAASPPLGLRVCSEYYVHVPSTSSEDVMIFIHGITGSVQATSSHWAVVAKGTGVTFKNGNNIGIVYAKTASGTSVFNAFPTGQGTY